MEMMTENEPVAAGSNGRPPDDTVDRRVVDVMTVAARILEHSNGVAGLGQIPCPICRTGIVSYSIAGPRAIAARCSTEDCVAFMS